MISKKNTLILLIVFLIVFILFHWNTLNAPLERDEGEYAYNAQLLSNNLLPYENSFLTKPPLIIYHYYLAQLIKSPSIWPIRSIAALYTAGSIVLLFLIIKKVANEKIAWLGAFISLPLLIAPYLTLQAANTEKFMIVPLLGTLLIFFQENKQSYWHLFIASCLSALAILFKPLALAVTAPLFIIWLINNYREKNNIKLIFQQILIVISGHLILFFLCFIPFLKSWVALQNIWEQVILFNLYYASQMKQYLWSVPLDFLQKFWHYWWHLILILFVGFIIRPKTWWFFFTLLIISYLSVFTSIINHYYLLVIPFIIILVSIAIYKLCNYLKLSDDSYNALIIFITFVFFIIQVIPIRNQFLMNPEQITRWIYGLQGNPFIESQIIGKKIKQITQPQDNIFIAGSESQIYYYSQRVSSSANITYQLNIDSPLREKYQQQVVTDLKEKPPTVIVVAPHPFSGLWQEGSPTIFINYLNQILKDQYQLIGGYVWQGDNGSWQEPISNDEQFNNANLLLFVKK